MLILSPQPLEIILFLFRRLCDWWAAKAQLLVESDSRRLLIINGPDHTRCEALTVHHCPELLVLTRTHTSQLHLSVRRMTIVPTHGAD